MTMQFLQDCALRVLPGKMPEAIQLLRSYAESRHPETSLIADDQAFIREITYELNGWEVHLDDGSIKDPFISERDYISINVLDAIAPCIESGSYVQIWDMDNEDSHRYVWINGSQAVRIAPKWEIPATSLFAVPFRDNRERQHVAAIWAKTGKEAVAKAKDILNRERGDDGDYVSHSVPVTLWGDYREITVSYYHGVDILWHDDYD